MLIPAQISPLVQSSGLGVLDTLAGMAVLSLPSPASRRNYSRELKRFLESGLPLNREGLLAWLVKLRNLNAGRATQGVSLAAVRLLAREANARGMLSDTDMAAIERVKGPALRGKTLGRWLTLADIQPLIDAARESPVTGVRDAAIIALLVGCGLRRAELSALDWSQVREVEGRTVLADIHGKGGRIRTVPVPPWAARYLFEWKAVNEIKEAA